MDYVARYRAAQAELEALKMLLEAANRDGPALSESRARLSEAARELVRDASGRHQIEEAARVYLVLGSDGWKVDSLTLDSGPLDGYDHGASTGACGHGDGLDDECEALADAAAYAYQLPTGDELARMLKLGPKDLNDLAAALGDAWAYRVGEGDPNDPDICEVDREGMTRANRLGKLFGVAIG